MKALLEKCKATFNLQVQIPALNLRLSGPDFFNHFKEYCQSEEWKYFLDKKVQPLSDQYFSGYLANIPTGKNYSLTKNTCSLLGIPGLILCIPISILINISA